MIRYKVIGLLLVIFLSCGSHDRPDQQELDAKFQDRYIGFSYPRNWVVSEVDSTNNRFRIYTLEKTSSISNSTILNLIVNFNAKKKFAFFSQTYIINETYDNVSFSEASEIEFLKKPTIMSTYSFKTNLIYVGANFSLQCGNNVLGINYQFSKDEEKESLVEINSILNTLNLSKISN